MHLAYEIYFMNPKEFVGVGREHSEQRSLPTEAETAVFIVALYLS
jgi:hypothetical protein